MANVSVQIETRIKHDLSLSFQAVAGDESLNVGTLVGEYMKSVEELDVFKLAHELALKVYKVTTRFPR
jgi:hypothetical protein